MGRKGKPSLHQADSVGHVRTRSYDNGVFQGEVPRFFGRCKCGWQCKYSRATRQLADADTRQHIEDAKRAVA